MGLILVLGYIRILPGLVLEGTGVDRIMGVGGEAPQATPLQGERVGAPSATETPALALRNEVARRQRVRARLAMLRKSK